jgi:hypothetical protein
MAPYQFASDIGEADDPIALQEYFFEQDWTDGLPIVPPTPERVSAFLDEMGLQPNDVLCVIPTRNRALTAEKVAINTVMAGCRPDYFPVVVTILQAMAEPAYNFHGSITSTGGAAPFVVVNGPVRDQLQMNSGVNVLGPGNRANATIGRAIRLVLMNVAGARPGVLDKSTLGHAGKYSYCIAEAEAANPWEPLHVERGFNRMASTVTVFAGEAPHGIQNHDSGEAEELLYCMAREMASIGAFTFGQSALILAPEHAAIIGQSGWSKAEVKAFLFEHATQSLSDLRRTGKISESFAEPLIKPGMRDTLREAGYSEADADRYLAVARDISSGEDCLLHRGLSADDILIVVAGGAAGGHSAFIPSWSRARISLFQTKAIEQTCTLCEVAF